MTKYYECPDCGCRMVFLWSDETDWCKCPSKWGWSGRWPDWWRS